MDSKLIVKDIKKSSSDAEIISVTNEIRNFAQENDIPIYAIRIIFYLINQLRHNQFTKIKAKQLQLSFNDSFLTEHNTHTEFTISYKDIAVNSRNYNLIYEALEYLENYKKGWYKAKNNKGELIESYGGFISNVSKSKKGVYFTVSSYWLNQILNLDFNYNHTLYKIAFILSSSKRIQFYLWLTSFENTEAFFYTINERFKIAYKDAKSLTKDFLKPIKIEFDRVSDISFNYTYSKNKIKIIKYYTKKPFTKSINETVSKKLETRYTLSYLVRRHKIKPENTILLKEVLEKKGLDSEILKVAYKYFIKIARRKKEKATKYEDKEFLNSLQKCIIAIYQRSKYSENNANNYPKVI